MLSKRIKIEFNDCGPEDMQDLGDKMRGMRRDAGKSQQELADDMLRDRSSVSKFELGVSMPTVQVLNDIARALGYKLSLTFEKVVEEELSDAEYIKSTVNEDIGKLIVLKEYLYQYSRSVEQLYLGDNEDYYYGDINDDHPDFIKYNKNRINYAGSIILKNSSDCEESEIKIYLDNPTDYFIMSQQEWDDKTYISVTGLNGDDENNYKLRLIKEDYFENRKVSYEWKVDTPKDVVIAAENIRNCYLEKRCFKSVDITNKNSLTVASELKKDIYQEVLKDLRGHFEVINSIEDYNNRCDDYYIDYALEIFCNNDCESRYVKCMYKNTEWAFNWYHGKQTKQKYELSIRDGSEEKTIKFSLDSPEDVLNSILKYS